MPEPTTAAPKGVWITVAGQTYMLDREEAVKLAVALIAGISRGATDA